MKILLTNDDGYGAEGIETLRSVLSSEHQVYIFAPEGNRSGSSGSLVMSKKLSLTKRGENAWSLDGSPVDCVISALRSSLLPEKPDLILSGINHGANLGTDITYSGTCGAARQGALYGLPSVAVSLSRDQNENYDFLTLSNFVKNNLELLVSLCGKAHTYRDLAPYPYFVNLNAPSVSYRGVRFTEPCHRVYPDIVEIEESDSGLTSMLSGGTNKIDCLPWSSNLSFEESDGGAVEKGFVSISRLYTMPEADNSSCAGMESDFVF